MQARTSNLHLSTNPFCIPSFAVRKIQASASTDKAGSKHRKLSHLVNTKCILSHEEYTPAFFCTLEGASRPTLFDKCVRRTRTRLVEPNPEHAGGMSGRPPAGCQSWSIRELGVFRERLTRTHRRGRRQKSRLRHRRRNLPRHRAASCRASWRCLRWRHRACALGLSWDWPPQGIW